MGGREPAQVVAPLQTKPFHVEIDETGDGVIEREQTLVARACCEKDRADIDVGGLCDCR
jgi:hypothetical protein